MLLYKVASMSPKQVREEIDSIVADTVNIFDRTYKGKYESDKRYLKELTNRDVQLAHSNISDVEVICELGEGWVAEEIWAITLFALFAILTVWRMRLLHLLTTTVIVTDRLGFLQYYGGIYGSYQRV